VDATDRPEGYATLFCGPVALAPQTLQDGDFPDPRGGRKSARRSDRPSIRCGAHGTRNNDDGASDDDANIDGASNVRLLERFARWQKPYQ
jgi:hypothetical protein